MVKFNVPWRFVKIKTLDFQDWIRRIVFKMQLAKELSDITNSLTKNYEAKAAILEAAYKEDLNWYKKKLRKNPYWANGHLRVGQIQFFMKEMNASFSAALAVTKLISKGLNLSKARHLIGKIYLHANSFAQAVQILEKVNLELPQNSEVIEDLAAGYLGLSNFNKAYDLLNKIGEKKLSQEGLAVFQYLKQKTS